MYYAITSLSIVKHEIYFPDGAPALPIATSQALSLSLVMAYTWSVVSFSAN